MNVIEKEDNGFFLLSGSFQWKLWLMELKIARVKKSLK